MKHLFFILTLCLSVTQIQAQKFGYINSAALLALIPEVKSADTEMQAYEKQLKEKGQGMILELQKKYEELQRKDQSGEISPKQLETETKMLSEEEAKIQEFDQSASQQISSKKDLLLKPIIDKVNQAIQEVAKEKGYSYIFDASPGSGVLLYAEESTDVMPLVKAKLNIQ